MQSLKKIYIVVMKLNWFFALHFFANGLYSLDKLIYVTFKSDLDLQPT